MSGYLAYHPKRAIVTIDDVTVHHDPMRKNNQDPYIWNTRFLHSYCHISQMSPQKGDYIFWVNGNTFPYFTSLYCDLVFIVDEKIYWTEANMIAPDDPLVDTETAFYDHYQWAMYQHQLKKRRRFTLKATAQTSFQPQDGQGHLYDIVPLLIDSGYTLPELHEGLRAGFQSKPMRLDGRAEAVYHAIDALAMVKLRGDVLCALKQRQ